MQGIPQILHGSYGYLLILQILLVAGLSLFLLVLIVKRLKATVVNEPIPASMDHSVLDAANLRLSELQKENEAMELRLKEHQAQPTSATMSEADGKLTDKVKFLESKLIEYEILQEEIGALSTLKMENEKLRQDVQKAQSAHSVNISAPKSSSSLLDTGARDFDNLMTQIDNLASK